MEPFPWTNNIHISKFNKKIHRENSELNTRDKYKYLSAEVDIILTNQKSLRTCCCFLRSPSVAGSIE